ncbi:MAG: M13 family metallopeptidase [Lachnospiraceae bacterium]|nr:M13 family metallopeptidase [Lachnospiraceae bacterium]
MKEKTHHSPVTRAAARLLAMMLAASILAGCAGVTATQQPSAASPAPAEAETETTDEEAPAAEPAAEAEAPEPEETDSAGEPVEAPAEEETLNTAGGSPWIESCARENITEDMELSVKDNYYLYVNHDAILRQKNGEPKDDPLEKIQSEIKALLEDDSAENHAVELVQDYYHAFVDWDARNAAGFKPLQPILEDIEGITSLEEFSDFLADPKRSMVVPMMLRYMPYSNEEDPLNNSTGLYFRGWGELLLLDPAEYIELSEDGQKRYDTAKLQVVTSLTTLGWSEADAVKAFEDYIACEAVLSTELDSFTEMLMSLDSSEPLIAAYLPEIQEAMQDYPITRILTERGFDTGAPFVHESWEYMRLVGDFYKEENLDLIKHYHLVALLLAYGYACDEETYLLSRGMEDHTPEDDFYYSFTNLKNNFSLAMDEAYVTRYDRSGEKAEMEELCADIKGVYREMLRDAEWMSEEGREKAIEKLDAMKVFCLYPDTFPDMSGLDFTGMSFLEIAMAADAWNNQRCAEQHGKTADPEIFAFNTMPTLEDNAKSFPNFNAFLFTVAIIDSYHYSVDVSLEEKLATVGYAMGHEISHCFDENGSKFDKDGKMNEWWTPEDGEAFRARVNKVVDYFSGISPFEGVYVNGDTISAEATADLTGFAAVMKLAEKVDGFDYDKFFRAFAAQYAYCSSYEQEMKQLRNDPHPLDYLRVNVTLQQFDKFLETYDIHEGDGMYLAPEDRILVW